MVLMRADDVVVVGRGKIWLEEVVLTTAEVEVVVARRDVDKNALQ